MLTFPNIDPVALKIGPVSIYWYGISYLLGFATCILLFYRRGRRLTPPWGKDEVIDVCFYVAIGVIFGGSLGFLLFYEPHLFLSDPLRVLRFWEPGRSFHGGLLGVILAVFVYGRLHHRSFFSVMDNVALVAPIALGLGRIGNFINGELWGRPTTLPWGMVFPNAGVLPRHPSQLYEFCLEGIVLFIILQLYARTPKPTGSISGLFLIFYGLFRFIVEFFREPDLDQGFIAFDWLTKGQALSIPMMVVGLIIFLMAKNMKRDRS